jgi:hypothetical protein
VVVFWVVALYNPVEIYLLIALTMQAGSTSETSVNFHHIARCYNPEKAIFRLAAVRKSNILNPHDYLLVT